MSHTTPYPSPPYSQPDHMDQSPSKSLLASTWHVLEQPPPPTLREILNAYRSKGDGDRDMLLAMLNAKTAEDQRIAAIATLHQKLLDARVSSPPPASSFVHPPGAVAYPAPPNFAHHAVPLSTMSPSTSSQDIKLPSIQTSSNNARKRPRSSQSPPPVKRRASGSQSLAPSEQLPPSPPFSSPGRSALSSGELQPQARSMAIGSLLSTSTNNQHDVESEWPSRTSAERTGTERESYRRSRASG